MAQTGRAGGRQSLENTRVKGDIHSKPPEAETADQHDLQRNASVVRGKPNTNRIGNPDRPPEKQTDFPAPPIVSYAGKKSPHPNTNRK